MTTELWAGGRPSEYDALNNLFGALTSAHIDEEAGRRAGGYLTKYRRSYGVELADALIADNAVAHQAELWTRNRKHYRCKKSLFSIGNSLEIGRFPVNIAPFEPFGPTRHQC